MSTHVSATAFRLVLLGVPELRPAGDGEPSNRLLGPGKPLVLLARLCLEPGGMSRDQLAAFLWPDIPEARARASSRQALHVLRQVLGADVVIGDRQRVRMAMPIACDVQEFLEAAESGEDARTVSLYRGPFLAEQSLADANEAEEWIAAERRRLSRLFVRAGTRLVQAYRNDGEWERALPVARRLRDEAPEELGHWQLLLETLADGGDRDALDFEIAALRARADVGQLNTRHATRDAQRLTERFLDLSEPAPQSQETERPHQGWRGRFVGRRQELRRLHELWAQVTSTHHGQRLVVSGHAGVGKSRLLAEFSRRPQVEGATVLWIQAKRGGRADRHGFLADVVALLTAQPGSIGIMQESAAALVGLVPSLASVFPGVAWREQLRDRQHLVHAVRDLLATLADERALLLVLDDTHRADDESLAVLDAVTSRLDGLSVMIVAASRPRAVRSAESWEQLDLGPLDRDQLGALVGDLEGTPIAPSLVDVLTQVTGGLPLQVLQALRLMAARGLAVRSQGAWTLAPDGGESPMLSVRDLVQATVSEQTTEARRILAFLALADAVVSRVQLSGALGHSIAMDRTLRELEDADLVVSTATNEWQIAHDVVADAVLHALPLEERRTLSLAVATLGLESLATRMLTASEMRRLVRLLLDAEAQDGAIAAIVQWHGQSPNAPRGAALADLLLGPNVTSAVRRRVITAVPERGRSAVQTAAAVAASVILTLLASMWWLSRPAELQLVNTPFLLPRAGVPPIFEVHDWLGRVSNALDGDSAHATVLFGDDSTGTRHHVVITNGLIAFDELAVLYSSDDFVRHPVIRMRVTTSRLAPTIIPILAPERDSLWLEAGMLNRQNLDPAFPTVRVAAGDSLTGWIRVRFNSPHAGILIMMSQFSNWMPASSDTVSVASLLTPSKRAFQYIPHIQYRAPMRPGSYWLTWTFASEPAAVWIASSTSWRCGAPVWTDGNEKTETPPAQLAALWGHGGRLRYRKRLCEPGEAVRYEPGDNPAMSIKVIVE